MLWIEVDCQVIAIQAKIEMIALQGIKTVCGKNETAPKPIAKRIPGMIKLHILTAIVLSLTPIRTALSDELLSEAQIQHILNQEPSRNGDVSTPRKVLICWSAPDHPKGTHAYKAFAKSFASTLDAIGKIDAITVEDFPTNEQWKDADLVVFYLTQKSLSDRQLATLDEHLFRGRSLMVIHQGLVQRAGYDNWANRIGFAFSWEKTDAMSKWGRGNLEIEIDTSHEIFRGFPNIVTVPDELYWNLKRGSVGETTVLGKTFAPKPARSKKVDEPNKDRKWPVFWTVEHPSKSPKKGRVFCCVIGHFNEVQEAPFLRIVFLRAAAWCLDEPIPVSKSLARTIAHDAKHNVID